VSTIENIFHETIAAISTPPGTGAIGIVRITGADAFSITQKIYRGSIDIEEARSHSVEFGKIIDPENKEIVDLVLVNIMRGPKTYTGFDTIEINCHGGLLTPNKILNLVLKNGARLADPGEFTKLAYINGKIDLVQVEAVADIIHAKTEAARRSSLNQFMGSLTNEIKKIREELLQLSTLLELDIDFGEEHLIEVDIENIIIKINSIETQIKNLLATYTIGHLIREGAKISIVGKPNVGKSSLLNALLLKERAIVSETPGTTRDFIEESIDLNGIPFTFIDTAGLRHTDDHIEKIGMDNTRELIRKSDLVLMIIDGSKPLDTDDHKIIKTILEYHQYDPSKKMMFVKNKTDMGDYPESNPQFDEFIIVPVSAKYNIGLDELRKNISLIFENNISYESPIITKTRHKFALEKSLDFLNSAKKSISEQNSFEFVTFDIRNCIQSLNEIIGSITSEDVLNSIFSSFCIGK
jgi:tRNA modification GTPase